jgi:hypothetical protein
LRRNLVVPGVEALSALGTRYGVDRIDGLLLAWLGRHETRAARASR